MTHFWCFYHLLFLQTLAIFFANSTNYCYNCLAIFLFCFIISPQPPRYPRQPPLLDFGLSCTIALNCIKLLRIPPSAHLGFSFCPCWHWFFFFSIRFNFQINRRTFIKEERYLAQDMQSIVMYPKPRGMCDPLTMTRAPPICVLHHHYLFCDLVRFCFVFVSFVYTI